MMHRYYPYFLRLEAPVILNSVGGDPSSARTLTYVPGGVIRGIVARSLGDTGQDRARLEEFRSLSFNRNVCFLNAYPTDGSRRTLPAPVSYRVKKEDGGYNSTDHLEVLDLAAFSGVAEDHTVNSFDAWPEDELDDFPYPYLSFGADLKGVYVNIGSRVHHQRDRRIGRAWVERDGGLERPHGSIFTYEYLEAGQEFAGVIKISGSSETECDLLFERIKKHLAGPLLLGRSRRVGYGGNATISWGPPRDREVLGEGVIHGNIPKGGLFRILAISPWIIRDPETGQVDPAVVEEELEQLLGLRAKVVRKRWHFELIGGFNRKWRLELPQARAVAGGSVFVLEAKEEIPLSAILRFEHEGIGERLNEGFGRMLFLAPPIKSVRVTIPAPKDPRKPEVGPTELVHFIERRILQNAVFRQIKQEAAVIARDSRSIPTASLLGRLRVPLRGDPGVGLATLREWLGEGTSALRHPARKQLDRCKLKVDGGKSLLAWMRDLTAAGNEEAFQLLNQAIHLDVVAQQNYLISEATAKEKLKNMAEDLMVSLVDAVLEALSEQKRKEAHGGA